MQKKDVWGGNRQKGEKKTGERKRKPVRGRQTRVQMKAFHALLGVVRVVWFYVSK